MARPAKLVVAGAVALGLAAAGASGLTGCVSTREPVAAPRPFPVGAAVDYQLGGGYDVPDGVGIVVRDSTERPAAGVWSICYVNGFQTQPGEERRWSGRRAELLLRDDAGRPVADPGWPDERLLDTSGPAKRRAIAEVIDEDLTRCADRGFDAVEIDNLDSFTRDPGGRLTLAGNEDLAVLYARRAHELGLLIGQKNTAEHSRRLRDRVGFDFAVAEECVTYDECAAYTDVYGEAVLDIEYPDSGSAQDVESALRTICADRSIPAATVLRDLDLVPAGEPGHVYRRCPPS